MSDFFYRVKDVNNKIIQGTINAVSISDAAERLEHKGYTVLEIKEEASNKYSKQEKYTNIGLDTVLTISEKKEFFNSFYFLYKSGLSVIEIFKSMITSTHNQKLKSICLKISKSVERGESLKNSLKKYAKVLGLAYVMLVSAGEESGKLDDVLQGILKALNKEEEIKSKIITAVTYPCIIFLLAIGVALIFKFFVFEMFNKAADGVNAGAVAISAIIKIVFIYALIGIVVLMIWKNKKILRNIISFFSGFLFISNILKNYYFSNFFTVMALAYESGITAGEALHLANTVINIPSVNRKLNKAEDMVYQGCEMATALGVSDVFSADSISQVSSGEKAGELDKVFKTIAHNYENHLEVALQAALKLIEPVMIGIVGIFVAYIAVNAYKGYYSAIFSMF